MSFSQYAFAFYVFLLVCGVIVLYGRVTRGKNKKDEGSYEKEQRLFTMYQNVEDMLDGFEAYAEEVKTGIEERMKMVERARAGIEERLYMAEEARVCIEERLHMVEEAKAGIEECLHMAEAIFAGTHGEEDKPRAEKAAEAAAEDEPEDETGQKPHKNGKITDKQKPKTQDLIQQYLEAGMSKEDVAKTLGISMREVSLIMEIKKIHVPEDAH